MWAAPAKRPKRLESASMGCGCRILLTAVAAVTLSAQAQDEGAARPLFASDTPLVVTIEAPLRQLARSNSQRPARSGTVRYLGSDGKEVALDVDLRVRGNSRLEICDFPPLRLDFKRKQVAGTLFAGQNRLKLVTLCQRRDNFRDYLALEYDVYRLLNALTDVSFRVRWLTVDYVSTDAQRAGERFTEPAFLIEEDEEVAERHGLEVVEVDRIALDAVDAAHTALMSLFEFMIGNTDWAATQGPPGEPCCHNGKLIGGNGRGALFLPYDFDQSGLIDTSYAAPNQALPIRTVRNRLYRGYCVVNSELENARALINERRAAMESVLQDSKASESARMKAQDFLADSFAIINDPRRYERTILDNCR